MDIQQVSKRAGVSTATVSRVLNGSPKVRPATSERVRKVIAKLNYVPNNSARNLRMGRSEMFGLIVSDIRNPFFPDLIDQFDALATAHQIDVVFTHTNYHIQRLAHAIRRLVERNVDGIAVMTSEVDEAALRPATQRDIPVVLLNQPSLRAKYRTVQVDYARGYREALGHLVELGHRNVLFLSGPDTLSSVHRRRKAFEAAAKNLGIQRAARYVSSGDMQVEGGRIAMENILRLQPRPTALIAANDLLAVGAVQAAIAAGLRVPRDISIIGFDDLPVATMMHPKLTTIHLSRQEIAEQAFSQLMDFHDEKSPVTKDLERKIRPSLVVRESTGAAPKNRARHK